jgi:AraC-like DNA-binding protein/predicted transcriptional regulator YdeE
MRNMYEDEILVEIKDFIEKHLDEEITLKKISDSICYSEEYTSRFFRKITGENLFDFIRSKRLLNAAAELKDKGGKIINIAFTSGFNSHEGFTRAFSSYFGISPVKFREIKPEIKNFMPRGFKVFPLGNKEINMDKLTIFKQVVERPQRILYLLRGKTAENYFEYCEEVGCDIWGRLLEIKNPLSEPIGVWLPEPFRTEGTSRYAQGVEVGADYSDKIPDSLDSIKLPPCKYMIFQSEPYEENLENMISVITQVQDSIKKYDPHFYGFEWAENDGPRFQLEPLGIRGYIEGLPVRLKQDK